MKNGTFKKVLALGLAAAMTIGGSAMTALAVDEGLEITVQNASEPNTIDPNEVNANDCMALVLHMYEGLTRYRQDLAGVELAQAESVDVSEDGLTWTWHLRDDILWSDGQPVTAGDFVYSWQRLVSGSYDNSNFIDMVENAVEIRSGEKDASELGVVAEDDRTLVVSLKNTCTYFDQIVAAACCSPVRQDMVETGEQWYTDPETNIGNGAFVMTEWVNQDHIEMVASDTYYDKEKVGPEKLTWLLTDDANTTLANFEGGEIMYAGTYPTEEIDRMKDAGYLESTGIAGTYYIMFNEECDVEALKDPRVRLALSLVIDRNYIVEKISKQGEIPADAWIGPGFPDAEGNDFHDANENKWWSIDPADYEANVEQAKALMEEAGYPNGEGFPTIKYATNDNPNHRAIAEYLQSIWKEELGVEMTVDIQEWAVFLEMRNQGDYELARGGWTADFLDPSSLFDLCLSTGGNNDTGYANEAYDELMYKAQQEPDPAARFGYFHEAEDMLKEDLPFLPLYYYTASYLADSENYEGYFNYLAFPMFRYVHAK